MPKLLLDFTNVEVDNMEPIPAGVYDAVIDGSRIELRTSQSGNEVLNVPFIVQNHPEYTGRVVFENYALTDKAKWKLAQLLDAVGMFDRDNRRMTLDTDTLHNKRVRIEVIIDTYNDQQRNRVRRVAPPVTGGTDSGKKKSAANF